MDVKMLRLTAPITTGIPQTTTASVNDSLYTANFDQVLKQQLSSSGLNFSKHAVNRVVERNIDIGDTNMERLNAGVEIAREKGLDDTLILVDKSAYIVSVKNNTVITTVSNEELVGNCFTNIEGTVIV
ncbi:MAG: flagellar protein [Ruminococcus sp.]|nr:flagellar protein [Ruminococcus sp.]MBR1753108.1 flagellar protein [Ruminococcus sp.]